MSDDERTMRLPITAAGEIDVPAVLRRLHLAERVLAIQAGTAVDLSNDRGKAALQAWIEWRRAAGHLATNVSDDEVLQLAARRDVTRNLTLIRLRREREA